jgi:hypothetical protein
MNPLIQQSSASKYALTRELRACHSHSRRNGKVARLPAELRNQINQMLDDGILYKVIIEKLGEHAKHLNEDNLSNWRLGGYQDYLNAQAINDRARVQTEAAADVVRDTSDIDPSLLRQACEQIAMVQYMDTLVEHGDEIALNSLKRNPAKMITLMNALSNLSNAGLALDKRKSRLQRTAPVSGAATCSFPQSNLPEPNRTPKK